MYKDNLYIQVDKNERYYSQLKNYFTLSEWDNYVKRYKKFLLYKVRKDGGISIPLGLEFIVPEVARQEIVDKSDHSFRDKIIEGISYNLDDYKHLLKDLELRDDQAMTVVKALSNPRSSYQESTGSGKTLCFAALLKYMINKVPDTNALIIVPTNYLVDEIHDRLNDYGVPVVKYSKCRGSIKGVVISHPTSVVNDINKGCDFSNVKVLISDECHHISCATYSKVVEGLVNLEYSLGFSASIINSSKFPIKELYRLTEKEAKILGNTGNILMNLQANDYKDQGVLSDSKLIRVVNKCENDLNERERSNWHLVRTKIQESDERSLILAQIAKDLSECGLKSLILVSTISHAHKIANCLVELGLGEKVVCSFGTGVFEYYDSDEGKMISDNDHSHRIKFNSGDYSIMIGTSHIYEGADIQKLDSVILGGVGKEPRRVIQGVGRCLRKSKNGKYAYIIDLCDIDGGVLSYHSKLRKRCYSTTINKDSNSILEVDIDKFKDCIKELEGLNN